MAAGAAHALGQERAARVELVERRDLVVDRYPEAVAPVSDPAGALVVP